MKYLTKYTTRAFDINIQRRLKPTALDQYLQESAERQIKDRDLPYDEIVTQRHKAFLLSRLSIEIYGGVEAYGDIDAETWVVEARAANFPRAYELFSNGELIVRAYANWALVDTDTKKLLKQGDYDMSNYPHDEAPEMSIPARVRIPKDVELSKVGEFNVGFSLTDINKHLNNAKYLDILNDYIPGIEELELTSMNIRYVHEAPYKSNVEVYMSEPIDAGDMDPRAEKIVYFKTMVNGDVNVEAVYGYKPFK